MKAKAKLAEKIKAHIITLQNEHLSSPATLALGM